MPQAEDFDWEGQTLVDTDGEEVGTIEDLYVNSGKDAPAWAQVAARGGSRLVPLLHAKHEGESLQVIFSRELIESAPDVGPGEQLDADSEDRLHEHYGIHDVDLRDDTGIPVDLPGADSYKG